MKSSVVTSVTTKSSSAKGGHGRQCDGKTWASVRERPEAEDIEE